MAGAASPGAFTPRYSTRSARHHRKKCVSPARAAQAANSPVSAINASISLRRSLGLVA